MKSKRLFNEWLLGLTCQPHVVVVNFFLYLKIKIAISSFALYTFSFLWRFNTTLNIVNVLYKCHDLNIFFTNEEKCAASLEPESPESRFCFRRTKMALDEKGLRLNETTGPDKQWRDPNHMIDTLPSWKESRERMERERDK